MTQIEDALARANEVRFKRADYRRTVKPLDYEEGRRRVADILDENPPCLAKMRVEEVLRWVSRMREDITQPLLADAECTAYTTISALGDRRRALLVSALRRDRQWWAA